MVDTKIYPVVVGEFCPFCIFVTAQSKSQAKVLLENKYEWIKNCDNLIDLEPIFLQEGKIFAVDIEMNILNKSDELLDWLTTYDDSDIFADNANIIDVEVKNDTKTSEEKTEKKTEKKTDDSEEKSKSDSAKDAESKYLWV